MTYFFIDREAKKYIWKRIIPLFSAEDRKKIKQMGKEFAKMVEEAPRP